MGDNTNIMCEQCGGTIVVWPGTLDQPISGNNAVSLLQAGAHHGRQCPATQRPVLVVGFDERVDADEAEAIRVNLAERTGAVVFVSNAIRTMAVLKP
jgi:hypothetical protein